MLGENGLVQRVEMRVRELNGDWTPAPPPFLAPESTTIAGDAADHHTLLNRPPRHTLITNHHSLERLEDVSHALAASTTVVIAFLPSDFQRRPAYSNGPGVKRDSISHRLEVDKSRSRNLHQHIVLTHATTCV
ncbi:hypothetical protein AC578_2139 [Pseudocercospora eumusae]|uniref:Uncharacterized protein n=1 Tax=Pseudocercospora eumusae TaxID=321146 RepID=A0A139HQM2_9PEZI|nr:hypothetical protein AC578_2139 [Pseudocercospora eumusae]